MIKEIEIQGCVTVPEEVSMDDFIDKFIAFIEENKWSFGGGYRTIIDGYYINDDGTKGEYVLVTKWKFPIDDATALKISLFMLLMI